VISTPGVYDLPAAEYFADPVEGGSLSSTGARKLLPPSCPAKFAYDREHPKPPTRTFNLGHAAHKLTLGVGADLVDVDAKDYRTKAAQEKQRDAYDAGKIPLLPHERTQVEAMHKKLLEHRLASNLFAPGTGQAEQTLVWQDKDTGVWCRAMLDWLRPPGTRRALIADYKTTEGADKSAVSRSMASYRYWMQDPFYRDGVSTLGIDPDPGFVFVFQEKSPPYLVTVNYLSAKDVEMGRARNRRAREVYRDCVAAGVWPEHSDDIEEIRLPAWVGYEHEREEW
jgi:hypothetical protein